MRSIVFISILSFYMVFSTQPKDLDVSNTTWIYKYDQQYADSIIFSDSTYRAYVSEVMEWYYGDFFVKSDTIYMEKLGDLGFYVSPPDTFPNRSNLRNRLTINTKGELYYLKPERFQDDHWIEVDFYPGYVSPFFKKIR